MPGYERALLTVSHLFMIAMALIVSFLLRYDLQIANDGLNSLLILLPIALVVKGFTFMWSGLFRSWWRIVGIADLVRLFTANAIAFAVFAIAGSLAVGPSVPIALYCIDFIVCFLLIAGSRICIRIYREVLAGEFSGPKKKRILIYGAGNASVSLLKEIRSNPSLGYEVAGLVDDDRKKRGAIILGTRVLGKGRDIVHIMGRDVTANRRIEEIVIAMPTASGRQMREAVANCRAAGVPCKTIPGLGELLSGKVLSAQLRDISVTDLLGRKPVQLDQAMIRQSINGRSVLVTGGAGSIGSELCRQVARLDPARLVVFDHAESDLFRIDVELKQSCPHLEIIPVVGDIRNAVTLNETIRDYSISSIFHAAAYKHVPMMEHSILEAVTNNVVGTWNLAKAAQQNGVETFLMISTDKAVNPSSILGATKRAAELLVSSVGEAAADGTNFVSVRFGNVLGSNGSVVPTFQRQISAGGPVTVTHPDMRRYFMTIPEAVQLILQASTMGKRSEIFVLDMGEPVRIVDLAKNMIRLAGLEPDEDIEIRFVGMRPGEKLYEELKIDSEDHQPTYHELISIFKGQQVGIDFATAWLMRLKALIEARNPEGVVAHLQKMVPEYQPVRTGTGVAPLLAPREEEQNVARA